MSNDGIAHDLTPLVNCLGLYFQIRDDLINLADQEFFKLKSFCEDITEGKYSYPIIHCIRKSEISNDRQLANILKQKNGRYRSQKICPKAFIQSW